MTTTVVTSRLKEVPSATKGCTPDMYMPTSISAFCSLEHSWEKTGSVLRRGLGFELRQARACFCMSFTYSRGLDYPLSRNLFQAACSEMALALSR